MNEMELKKKRIVIRRKHTSTTFAIENNAILLDVTLDPYSGDAKLLALVNLKPHDVLRLRDLCNMLLGEDN